MRRTANSPVSQSQLMSAEGCFLRCNCRSFASTSRSSSCAHLCTSMVTFSKLAPLALPTKVIPFPPGALFSFFAFQVLRRLGLLRPGTKLHRLLSMGRPDGYDLLQGDGGRFYLHVSPAGLTLIVADPKVVTHVNSKRTEFPKPPNTGGEY